MKMRSSNAQLDGAVRLHLPEKLRDVWRPRRYKVMYGGRGGGKSWSVAAVLLVMAAQRPMRVLCAREIQNSIRDSVHRLLKDQIARIGLGAFYSVTDFEIRGANGSLFVFSGLQAHTVDSIKSFEGCDVVWVEEAHSVSKRSWDTLGPTLRREGSEIWMTLNPQMDTDDTWRMFVEQPSEDTWLCEINWRDNPWFPDELDKERRKCMRTNPDDYENIWEGKPRRTTLGAIYRHEVERLYASARVCAVPHEATLPVHTVWDLGWNDAMAIVLVQRTPMELRIIGYIEDSHRTLDWYVRELEKLPYRWGTDFIPHDGASGNYMTGNSTQEQLCKMGRSVEVLDKTSVEEGIKAARMAFARCWFDRDSTGRLLECLRRYSRATGKKGGEAMRPLHDAYSHGADAFRYLAMAAERMRNEEARGFEDYAPVDWRL